MPSEPHSGLEQPCTASQLAQCPSPPPARCQSLCFDALCLEGPWTRGAAFSQGFCVCFSCSGVPQGLCFVLESLSGVGFCRAASFAGGLSLAPRAQGWRQAPPGLLPWLRGGKLLNQGSARPLIHRPWLVNHQSPRLLIYRPWLVNLAGRSGVRQTPLLPAATPRSLARAAPKIAAQ
jgi:hypothetical protein